MRGLPRCSEDVFSGERGRADGVRVSCCRMSRCVAPCERTRRCKRCRVLSSRWTSVCPARDAPVVSAGWAACFPQELWLALPFTPRAPVCKEIGLYLVMCYMICSVSRKLVSGVFKEKCWLLPLCEPRQQSMCTRFPSLRTEDTGLWSLIKN